MTTRPIGDQLQMRTVWLSDIHLGYKDCKATYLLDFLQRVQCETLYLLGDVVDFWALRRQLCWPAAHYDVLRRIFDMARNGTRVVYVPGNHDETMRDYIGHCLGPVEILRETLHVTADGRSLLLFHGDCLDGHIRLGPVARLFGDAAYDALLFVNRWTNRLRRRLGLDYWSLAAYLKTRVRNAREAIEIFEHAAVAEARRRGLDGVVCGHIHKAEMRMVDGLLYCNDGDWVESCTALVEDASGRLDILHWSEQCHSIRQLAASNDEVLAQVAQLGVPGAMARGVRT